MNLDYIAQYTLSIVEETAEWIRKERSKWSYSDLKFKGDKSLVTSIDVGVEKRMKERLGEILPEAGFLAEETAGEMPKSDMVWILDPVDGTTNLVHNFPMYCISLALMKEGKLVLGVIYEIQSGECFWAYEGQEGAYLNNTRIKVSEAEKLSSGLIATGFPPTAFKEMDIYIAQFRHFMMHTQGLRRLGSAAMDLAYVACGRCDGFFEYRLNPWDVAAGAYIVQKAGGAVTDFKGGEDYLFGGQILASNGKMHEEFLKAMQM